MSTLEKRKTQRVPVSMNVDNDEAFESIGFGYAKDISEEGMAIDAQALIDNSKLPGIGQEIRLRFKLPKSNLVITATGKVIRVESKFQAPEIGLQFSNLGLEFKYEIKRYVYITLRN